MRRECAFALFVFLSARVAAGQQGAPRNSFPADAPQPIVQTVYFAGPGVTAPELIPNSASISRTRHCDAVDGLAELAATVDAGGALRDAKLLNADKPLLGDL